MVSASFVSRFALKVKVTSTMPLASFATKVAFAVTGFPFSSFRTIFASSSFVYTAFSGASSGLT